MEIKDYFPQSQETFAEHVRILCGAEEGQLDLSQIHSIEVRYINNEGTSQTMPLSSFKQKLKPTTYTRNDFIEINPSTFGTTREDLMESLYYRIITE